MLTQHLKAGNIKRLARGVFASVPAHGDARTWRTDRFLAASRLKPDAIIAYHSALELHGAAYTDAPDVQAMTLATPVVLGTPDFSCRFVRQPAGFSDARDVTIIDRAGLAVRVTTMERTIIDLFDRPDLAGGAEELFNSLALVKRVRGEDLVRQARALGNAAATGALGWWLETEKARLGVSEETLDALRALKPRHPLYVLGARKGEATSVAAWNILVPRALVADKSGHNQGPDGIDRLRYPPVMDRDTILHALRKLRSRLEARGIAHVGVFGSVARNQAKATSDIDIVVTPLHGRKLDLFDLGGVQSLLNEQFEGIDIDVVVEPVMRPELMQDIRQDRINAF